MIYGTERYSVITSATRNIGNDPLVEGRGTEHPLTTIRSPYDTLEHVPLGSVARHTVFALERVFLG